MLHLLTPAAGSIGDSCELPPSETLALSVFSTGVLWLNFLDKVFIGQKHAAVVAPPSVMSGGGADLLLVAAQPPAGGATLL